MLKNYVLQEQLAQPLDQPQLRSDRLHVHKDSIVLLVQQPLSIVRLELGQITWICLMQHNVLNVRQDSHVQLAQHQLIGHHVLLICIVLKDHLLEFLVLVSQILEEILV